MDLFGYIPEILYKGEEGFSSTYGGVVTLIVVLFYALSASFGLWRFFQRGSPETNINRVYVSDPVGFNMTLDTLPIAFGQQDSNSAHFMDPTVYTVTATYKRFMKTTKNGEIVTSFKAYNIDLTECSNLDLDKELFKNLALKNMYCFKDYTPQGIPIEVRGVFESDIFGIVDIALKRCKGAGCKTPEEIDKIIDTGYFAANYINRETRTSDYENPIEKYPTSFFTRTSKLYKVAITARMANNELTTANTLIDYLPATTTLFSSLASIKTDLLNFQINSGQTVDNFFSLAIRMDPLKNVTQRKYLTLFNYIAEFGGLAQVITIIGLVLTFRTKKHQLCIDLAKQICSREQKYQDILAAQKDSRSDEEQYSQTQKSNADPLIKVSACNKVLKDQSEKADKHPSQVSRGHHKGQLDVSLDHKSKHQESRADTQIKHKSDVIENMDVPEEYGGAQQVRPALLYTSPMANFKQSLILKKKHNAYQEPSDSEKCKDLEMAAKFDSMETPEKLYHSDDHVKPAGTDLQATKSARTTVDDFIRASTVNHRGERSRYQDMQSKLKHINDWMVFLYSYFPCLTKKSNTTAILDMVEKEVFGRYDLLNILDMYEDMKKLRLLLLTADQRLLFDLIASTKLTLNNKSLRKTFTLANHINQTNRQTEPEIATANHDSVLTAYRRILKQDSHSEIDRNLLRNLGFLYHQSTKSSEQINDHDFNDR